MYKYTGRSAAGVYDLKQQNAVIELQSRVIVQSIDESTIIVKVILLLQFLFDNQFDCSFSYDSQLTDGRIKRNGNFLDNPYFTGEYSESGFETKPGHPEEIEGEEDRIANPEFLGAPFVITHKKGSVSDANFYGLLELWF